MTVNEDMVPAQAEEYVFKWFQWRPPEVLKELYFVLATEGKIRTVKDAKKWLSEEEQVDALQEAAKRWRAIKLQHNGKDIRLRAWRYFWGQCVLFRQNVEDWNEGDEQSCLLNLLPDPLVRRVTKNEATRAKRNHIVKMMLNMEHHKKVVNWTKPNVARLYRRRSLQNALDITISGDREKAAIWRLSIPARMSCEDVLEWVGEEVFPEYKNLHHNHGLQGCKRSVHYVRERV